MGIKIDDMPNYTNEGRDAIELMYLDYASFFFYFEDDHHESVYERLIEKIFPKISRVIVICLGGKTKVLAKAKQERFPSITSIFVLDRDYDDFLNNIKVIPDVFYLEKFSFENYLTEKNALINLCIEENSRTLTKYKANALYFDFLDFHEKLVAQLLKLTKIHLVVRKYSIKIETTKISCDELLDKSESHPLPSENKIASYIDRVLNACLASKGKEWLSDRESLLNEGERIYSNLITPQVTGQADFCCGKHLLGYLIRYFDTSISKKLSDMDPISLYIRLLNHVDSVVFTKFRDKVIETYNWSE